VQEVGGNRGPCELAVLLPSKVRNLAASCRPSAAPDMYESARRWEAGMSSPILCKSVQDFGLQTVTLRGCNGEGWVGSLMV
jgi:hypothetical protein